MNYLRNSIKYTPMEDKFIWVARILIILGLSYVIYGLFFSSYNLNNAIGEIQKSKKEIDSALVEIRQVRVNLKALDNSAIETQKRLNTLRFQRDSLSRVYTNIVNKDRTTLRQYQKLLSNSIAQRDSFSKLINKFERVYAYK